MNAGLEQGDDIGLHHDRVDDQHDRRRDQDAERAAGRERAGGERARIVVAAQFRQCDLAHHRSGRERRAADGAERRRSRRPPPWRCRRGDGRSSTLAARNSARLMPALLGEMAHQQEQRNDRQIERTEAPVHFGLEEAQQGVGRQSSIADRCRRPAWRPRSERVSPAMRQ